MTLDDAFYLDVSFFLKKTKTRKERIGRLMRELGLPKPDGDHLFTTEFGAKDARFLVLHIDESKHRRDPIHYYVQMHLHGGQHPAPTGAEKGVEWALERVVELAMTERDALFFFEAEAFISQVPQPGSVVALPLTIGGRTLPVKGVEYGTELDEEGVDSFRWTRHEDGMKVTVSYALGYLFRDVPSLWDRERATVQRYVREAFGE